MHRQPELILSYPFRYAWQSTGSVSYIGQPDVNFLNNLQRAGDTASVIRSLKETDGQFALIVETPTVIVAATDRARSFPLFYQRTNDRFILTDNIPRCEQHPVYDDGSIADFLDRYCVPGDKTLLKNWKQLQAGECLVFDRSAGTVNTQRYFTFDDSGKNLVADSQLLRRVYLETFQELIAAAGERPFILPLSGGYDSRIIAACLKMLGAKRVFCYTYGRAGSSEIQVAEQVARALGFDWHYVEYHDALLDIFLMDDWNRYAAKNHHYTSLPHEQDYFALYALKRDGILPEDGIVLPGFLGDYFAGSMFKDKPPVEDAGQDQDDYIANRGCKFIVNAVRVYEHFGLEWRLPFASKRILDFWLDVSWKDRVYGNVYNDLVSSVFFQPLGIAYRKPGHEYKPRRPRYFLKSWLPANWLSSVRSIRSYRAGQDPNNTCYLLSKMYPGIEEMQKNMKMPFNEAYARFFLARLREKSVN